MSGDIPSDFRRHDKEDLQRFYAKQEVPLILKKLSKAHDVKFAPWVEDYAVFHWVHAKIVSHVDRQFEGANGIQVLEDTLRSCHICAAQQGHFNVQERLHGFVRKRMLLLDSSSDSD